MPNRKEPALRYLLLRFLWIAKEHVSLEVYQEVTRSLTVNKTNGKLIVTWQRNGQVYQKSYQRDEFKLYVRGDKSRSETDQAIDHHHNAILAREFAQDALGIGYFEITTRQEPFFPDMYLGVASLLVGGMLMGIAGGNSFISPVILILTLSFVEFWYPKGKIIVPLLIAGFTPIGLPFTTIVVGVIWMVFQMLDPNCHLRLWRIIIAIIAAGYGFLHIVFNPIYPDYDRGLVFVVGVVIITFLARWTIGSHFRSFPLLFPFLCLGLYMDGQNLPAVIGLAYSVGATILVHQRVLNGKK
jgi:hypothetical protein